MEQDSNQPSSKLLEPVNLVLSVKRNLAASWYQKMAAIEVDGDLKPMKVCSHTGCMMPEHKKSQYNRSSKVYRE